MHGRFICNAEFRRTCDILFYTVIFAKQQTAAFINTSKEPRCTSRIEFNLMNKSASHENLEQVLRRINRDRSSRMQVVTIAILATVQYIFHFERFGRGYSHVTKVPQSPFRMHGSIVKNKFFRSTTIATEPAKERNRRTIHHRDFRFVSRH